MEFSDWITQKFIRWRGDRVGRGSSVADFAKLFGATQPVLSMWMKKGGKRPKSAKYINALVAVYGDEVYQILGLTPPAQNHLRENGYGSAFSSLPRSIRSELTIAIDEINAIYAARKILPDSPEALAIADEVFARHGFSRTSKKN